MTLLTRGQIQHVCGERGVGWMTTLLRGLSFELKPETGQHRYYQLNDVLERGRAKKKHALTPQQALQLIEESKTNG